jgi:hypothetical protein
MTIQAPEGMTFTRDQELAANVLWAVANDHGVQRLAGYAGTGKSVLLAATARALAAAGITYQVVCPTGKAAARVRSLGINASTIHSWMYIPVTDKQGKLKHFRLRTDLDLPPRFVLLLDESSMLGPKIYLDIESIMKPGLPGRSILLFGDSYQLPPVLNSEISRFFLLPRPRLCICCRPASCNRWYGKQRETPSWPQLLPCDPGPPHQFPTATSSRCIAPTESRWKPG